MGLSQRDGGGKNGGMTIAPTEAMDALVTAACWTCLRGKCNDLSIMGDLPHDAGEYTGGKAKDLGGRPSKESGQR